MCLMSNCTFAMDRISSFICSVVFCSVFLLSLAQADCDPKFRRISDHHTACLIRPANESARNVVTEASKKYIVNLHNYYRANVHRYNSQPKATNMQKMYWDDELAELAQNWASNCIWDHDASINRNIPGSYAVGQNLGKGHSSWGSVIRHWQSEVRYLNFGKSKTSNRPVGHYTQMVWAGSSRIGCGYAKCNRTSPYYVCTYGPTGNFISEQFTPYETGKTTSKCPSSQVGGLCDCKGKICKNGGTLDLETCTCSCLGKPWLTGSDDCSLDCSKAEDTFTCSTKGGSFDQGHCSTYVNVPYAYCPIMCGLCPPRKEEEKEVKVSAITETIGLEDYGYDYNTATDSYNFDYDDDSWWESVLNGQARQKTTPIVDTVANLLETTIASVTTTMKTTHRQRHKTTPRTTMQPSTKKPSTTPVDQDTWVGLPRCKDSMEAARCGQPSERGYFDPKYCAYGIGYYCPAMCGTCAVERCQDYNNKEYDIDESWMNEYGKFTCTRSGVKVQRGCYIEKAERVLEGGDSYSYMDGNIRWQCSCSATFSLSCKGVWTRRKYQ